MNSGRDRATTKPPMSTAAADDKQCAELLAGRGGGADGSAERKQECESVQRQRAELRSVFFRSIMVRFQQQQQQPNQFTHCKGRTGLTARKARGLAHKWPNFALMWPDFVFCAKGGDAQAESQDAQCTEISCGWGAWVAGGGLSESRSVRAFNGRELT